MVLCGCPFFLLFLPFIVLLLLLFGELFFGIVFRADDKKLVVVFAHQLVAPPRIVTVFGRHCLIVLAAEIEVFECEFFLC